MNLAITSKPRALALAAFLFACSDASEGDSPSDVAETGEADIADTAGDTADIPDATPLTSAEVAAPGPYAVGLLTLPLEDTSRPTAANGDFAGSESRVLETAVWYPAVGDSGGQPLDAEPAVGPFPLILYSHGFMSSRTENAELAAHLASRGIVVAAPDFPLTSAQAPGEPNVADAVNQPADVRFVIDQVLARGSQAESPFGAIDPDRVALMGVSLGGLTSLVTAFHPDFRDPRVRAVLSAAAPGCYLPPEMFAGADLPLLLVHGDLDELLPYAEHALPVFAAAGTPKWLVTFEGGTHTAFGGVAVGLLSRLENPESVGCAALEANASISGGGLGDLAEEFLEISAEQADACPIPCTVEGPRPISMNAREQLDLFALVATAFFEEQLLDSPRAGHFLDVTLAVEQPDVTVQLER